MYAAVTEKVRVSVRPEFSAERSAPAQSQYFWTYAVDIANEGASTVRLLRRRWRITDALGGVETVEGPGVVGEQPTLAPGQSFSYVSGCPLRTASGIMAGAYQMTDETGRLFDVEIPAFSLDSPHMRKTLN